MFNKIGKYIPYILFALPAILLVGCAAKQTGESPAAGFIRQGEKHIERAEYREAIAQFRKAVGIDPQNADGYCGLGISYFGSNDMYRAEIFMRKALQLDKHLSELWGYLGDIYLQKNNEEKAMEFFERCPPKDPHYAKLHFRLGKMRLEKKDFAAADAEFSKALTHPQFWGGYWGKATIAKTKGDWNEALNWFREAYNICKKPEVIYGLAQSYDTLGHAIAAYFHYVMFLGTEPTTEETAEVFNRMEELERAYEIAVDTAGLSLSFSIPQSCDVNAGVCAKNGRIIKMLFSGTLCRGNYHLDWDGSDDEGKPAGNGEYIGFIVACDDYKLQKMILQ